MTRLRRPSVPSRLPHSGVPIRLVLLAALAWPSLLHAQPVPAQVQVSARPAARASAASAPVLELPRAMEVRGGMTADQALHASDPNGDPLTFSKAGGPEYMTVTTVDPGTGTALGNVHLAPGLANTGPSGGSVDVSDGSSSYRGSFSIKVLPILIQPAGMEVHEGATADQTVTALGSAHGALSFSVVSGPAFMTVTATGDSTGNIHLAPGFNDHGTYLASISVSDGMASNRGYLMITVYDENSRPLLAQPADMRAIPGTQTSQLLTASDPDDQALRFSMVSGPPYMTVGTFSATRGYVLLNPAYREPETVAVATVAVSDGMFTDQKSFVIQVAENLEPVLGLIKDMDLMEGMDQDQAIGAFDPDGQPLAFSVTAKPRFMSLATFPRAFASDSLTGLIRLMPGYDDAGTYTPTVGIWDGICRVAQGFTVTVRERYPGENSLRLAAVPAGQAAGAVDYEYSSDGPYSATPSPGGMTFRSTTPLGANWTLAFKAPAGLPLEERLYENAIVGASPLQGRGALYVSGSDPNVPGLMPCSQGTARFEIKRIVRRVDGSIISFWATFEQTCADSSRFYGEARYQVQSIPITLVAPRLVVATTLDRLFFDVSAVDSAGDAIALSASGLPAGAQFVDYGGSAGRFGWIPDVAQQGEHLIRFIASSAGGLADTALTTIKVTFLNHPPVAMANGPYAGTVGVPIPFTAAGTVDPDGDVLSYLWQFGDRATGVGAISPHAYGAPGIYVIYLVVGDGTLSDDDTAIARVYEPGTARVFPVGLSLPVRLVAGAGRFCVRVEVGAALGPNDISSIRMRVDGPVAGGSIAADSTSIVVGDSDANGVADIKACFTRDDLRHLFRYVTGRMQINAMIDVALRNGLGFSGGFLLDVVGSAGAPAVLVAPNPLNPVGTFSFVTTRRGSARLRLFDHHGRLVRTLLDAVSVDAGYHDVPIDGRGENGTRLSSGVYYYRLELDEGNRTGRIAIVK